MIFVKGVLECGLLKFQFSQKITGEASAALIMEVWLTTLAKVQVLAVALLSKAGADVMKEVGPLATVVEGVDVTATAETYISVPAPVWVGELLARPSEMSADNWLWYGSVVLVEAGTTAVAAMLEATDAWTEDPMEGRILEACAAIKAA